jgi:site-specific DNA-adenine methylase
LEHGLNDLNEETLLEMLTFGNAADYPGSKWSLAEKIITLFPSHTTYVEPFFGSGAVYFNKPVSKIETINDLNGRVYNFFKVCRENPGELARRIMRHHTVDRNIDFVKR